MLGVMTDPCLWQSSLQVDSAPHSANSVGERKVSLHWQSRSPPASVQVPLLRPMALQVAWQKERPRSQREGSSARRLPRLIDFSLQMQSQSASQIPLKILVRNTHTELVTTWSVRGRHSWRCRRPPRWCSGSRRMRGGRR